MSSQFNYFPGDEDKQQNTPGEQTGNKEQEDVQISLPKIDRPEGPFEHSGETFNWTKEEKEEKEQEQ
ncbi:MAG TPA: hypothetical protein VER36_03680 [Flavisolibacter sp.]|nr:hypothetical protein [Flavisolibacter sp.]